MASLDLSGFPGHRKHPAMELQFHVDPFNYRAILERIKNTAIGVRLDEGYLRADSLAQRGEVTLLPKAKNFDSLVPKLQAAVNEAVNPTNPDRYAGGFPPDMRFICGLLDGTAQLQVKTTTEDDESITMITKGIDMNHWQQYDFRINK